MYCVLDSLDECEDEPIRWLDTHLTKALRQTGETKLRIAIVSRHLPKLKDVEHRLLIDTKNNDKVEAEVKVFTTVKLQSLSQRMDLPEYFMGRIQSKLVEKAGAAFLWIGFAVNDPLAERTAIQIQAVMSDLPVAHNSLYGRTLHTPYPQTDRRLSPAFCAGLSWELGFWAYLSWR